MLRSTGRYQTFFLSLPLFCVGKRKRKSTWNKVFLTSAHDRMMIHFFLSSLFAISLSFSLAQCCQIFQVNKKKFSFPRCFYYIFIRAKRLGAFSVKKRNRFGVPWNHLAALLVPGGKIFFLLKRVSLYSLSDSHSSTASFSSRDCWKETRYVACESTRRDF